MAHALIRETLLALPKALRGSLISTDPELFHAENWAGRQLPAAEIACYQLPDGDHASLAHGSLWQLENPRMWRPSPPGQLVVISVDSEALASMPEGTLETGCSRFRRWAEKQQLSLLIVSPGDHLCQLFTRLICSNDALSGLAHCSTVDGQLQLKFSHWRNQLGVAANQAFRLLRHEDRFQVDEIMQTPVADEQRILAVAATLEGHRPPTPWWTLFPTEPALMEAALSAEAATVVLCINTRTQLEALVRQIHALRSTRGKHLKLVVREQTPCLRHMDENMLARAGASLVVPASSNFSRFLSQIDALQGQCYLRPLPANIDLLLLQSNQPVVKGYQAPDDFVHSVRRQLADPLHGAYGLLVTLTPAINLSVFDVLAQCTIKRGGDLITLSDTALYLYLYACRASDLADALANLFHLPAKTLFRDTAIISEQHQIDIHLEHLTQWQALPADTVLSTGARTAFESPRSEEPAVAASAHQRHPGPAHAKRVNLLKTARIDS